MNKDSDTHRTGVAGDKDEDNCIEEEVFLDANTSPDLTLRRSARKRKSVTEPDLDTHAPKTTGKRHRPLGTMAGVQRSPANTNGSNTANRKGKPHEKRGGPTNDNPAELTVESDPPTERPSKEQLILLGGCVLCLRKN